MYVCMYIYRKTRRRIYLTTEAKDWNIIRVWKFSSEENRRRGAKRKRKRNRHEMDTIKRFRMLSINYRILSYERCVRSRVIRSLPIEIFLQPRKKTRETIRITYLLFLRSARRKKDERWKEYQSYACSFLSYKRLIVGKANLAARLGASLTHARSRYRRSRK